MKQEQDDLLMTEFLILPDGTVLVQNLTPVMASLLLELNPHEEAIQNRAIIDREN